MFRTLNICLLVIMLLLLGIFLTKTSPALIGLGLFALAGNIIGVLLLAKRQIMETKANNSQEEELLIAQIMLRVSKEKSDSLSKAQTTYNAIVKKYPYHKNLLLAKYVLFSMVEDTSKAQTGEHLLKEGQNTLTSMLSNLDTYKVTK